MENKITKLFNIEKPIIQGGMVWCSGWKLASAVSNAGGLGLIGAGSMHPDIFLENVRKTKIATKKPFGVNIPLMYPEIDKIIDIIIQEDVRIIFTSAGSPKKYTQKLKKYGIIVVHVVSSTFFALKCQDAGVDAIVAEGFEAGGHNGREETTTLSLIPAIKKAINIPIIAAGGIASGQSMLAAMTLGADAVQIGTLFACSQESSAHINFKNKIIQTNEGDTMLALKKIAPTRLIKNNFFDKIKTAENIGATKEELQDILKRGKSKEGMFLGDIENGELEIGQVACFINKIKPVKQIIDEITKQYKESINDISTKKYSW